MPRPSSKHPTELELAILKIVWDRGPSTVREVREALLPDRDLAHTSVMTIMTIMTKKGYLKRAKSGNKYVYRPAVQPDATTGGMLRDIVDRAFDGSAATVILNLLETADIDPEELEHLQSIIDRKVKEQS